MADGANAADAARLPTDAADMMRVPAGAAHVTGVPAGAAHEPAGAAPRPVPETFSTFGLPVPHRIELWEQHNAAALVGLDVVACSGSALQAAETSVRLPAVTLARVRGSAHAVHRSAAAIARDPCEAVVVYLPLRGEGAFRQHDSSLTLRPGQALLCDTDLPFAREFAAGLEELVVKVPHAALDLPPGTPASRGPTVVATATLDPRRSPNPDARYAAALARLAARATRTECPVSADERTVVELVAVLAAGRRAERACAYRAAARAFIEDHLTEPGLGADRVADAIGISERHMSRIFAADGNSLPRYVLARRLELAHALLAAPPKPGLALLGTPPIHSAHSSDWGETVAAIAAACGFTSTTYFSHVFARRFDRRAGELLRESRAHGG